MGGRGRKPRVAVIGAGHNGLAAAAYLARAGLPTVVLERRELVGGACVTEELWPGFRISRGAYVVGLLRPALVRELGLPGHGLRLLPRRPSSFTPLPEGGGLLLGPELEASQREIRRFSARDADRYPDYEQLLDQIARSLEPLLDAPPPDPARLRARDLALLARLAGGALRWRRDIPAALALLLGPARRTLEGWFESEPLRGTLATDAVIGAWASPSSPGTGYVLFHHVMGETDGARGVWAYVEGGMGRLSEALAAAARGAGAEIRCNAPVERGGDRGRPGLRRQGRAGFSATLSRWRRSAHTRACGHDPRRCARSRRARSLLRGGAERGAPRATDDRAHAPLGPGREPRTPWPARRLALRAACPLCA